MDAPNQFCVSETFRHRSPEFVRHVLRSHHFRQVSEAQGFSEIWVREAGVGYWLVRLDAAGHDQHRHFGARPRYYREWIADAEGLANYLRNRNGTSVWAYSDAGVLVGVPKNEPKPDDRVA